MQPHCVRCGGAAMHVVVEGVPRHDALSAAAGCTPLFYAAPHSVAPRSPKNSLESKPCSDTPTEWQQLSLKESWQTSENVGREAQETRFAPRVPRISTAGVTEDWPTYSSGRLVRPLRGQSERNDNTTYRSACILNAISCNTNRAT